MLLVFRIWRWWWMATDGLFAMHYATQIHIIHQKTIVDMHVCKEMATVKGWQSKHWSRPVYEVTTAVGFRQAYPYVSWRITVTFYWQLVVLYSTLDEPMHKAEEILVDTVSCPSAEINWQAHLPVVYKAAGRVSYLCLRSEWLEIEIT